MIAGLKPYPAMKDSSAPWLGKVPAHWEERRAKYFFREVDERSTTGAEELLLVSHKTGVTPRSQKTVTMFLAESTAGHKLCQPGDVVVNTMWAWMAALGAAKQSGLVSPSYGVYRPRRAAFIPEFLDNLLRTPAYTSEYIVRSTGVTASRLRLYPEELLSIPFLCPPLNEQATIVRFLDHADRRIRRYIRAKQKLIKLLEEQKQAIVHSVVTRGLDPKVRLKPSGVEWLGDVPKHWDVRRLKFLAHIKTGGRDTVDRKDDGAYPFFVRFQTVERIDSYSFDGEAVLTAGDGAGVAKVFHYVTGKFDYHQRVYKFSNFRHVCGRLFFHYFSCTLRFEAFRETAKSTVDSLRLPMLQNFPVPLPPPAEQDEIVGTIERETQDLNRSLDVVRREISLLREYRTRLIADVVTGTLDVREAAGRLPDEAEEPEPLDEADALTAVEEEGVDDLDAVPEEAEA